jgi:hypothetical protein
MGCIPWPCIFRPNLTPCSPEALDAAAHARAAERATQLSPPPSPTGPPPEQLEGPGGRGAWTVAVHRMPAAARDFALAR